VESYRGRLDGVMSSSDYPGATAAAAVATALGLPGPRPETVIRCSHKYYSRLAQREAVPEATPAFDIIAIANPRRPDVATGFPLFLKPVKGAFSIYTRRIHDPGELESFLTHPEVRDFGDFFMAMFNRLLGRYTRFEYDGGHFIAEELLRGAQVTVEGFATADGVEILGIVDSDVDGETHSFTRFAYPSALDAGLQGRMEEVARRAITHLGLRQSLFNIEMMVEPETGSVNILEINPRMCGQFADLYQKVDGVNGYEVALALAAGEKPVWRPGAGAFRVAASYPLRVFERVTVRRAPGEEDVRAVEARHQGTLVWSEWTTGQELGDLAWCEDGQSYRYGVVNTGAPDPSALEARFRQVREELGFDLVPEGADP